MAAHSTAVANKFLEMAAASGKSLTQMQLQKLVYIAHGWSLAINDEPLTSDIACAWDYGPVYPDLWEALRGHGRQPIERRIRVKDFGIGAFSENAETEIAGSFTEKQSALMSKVFESYGGFHAFQLSAMTHEDGTPWYQVFVEQGRKRGEILNAKIKEHFIDLARKRVAA